MGKIGIEKKMTEISNVNNSRVEISEENCHMFGVAKLFILPVLRIIFVMRLRLFSGC